MLNSDWPKRTNFAYFRNYHMINVKFKKRLQILYVDITAVDEYQCTWLLRWQVEMELLLMLKLKIVDLCRI